MRREDGTGEGGRVERGVLGASLNPRREGAYGSAGERARCSGPSNKCSTRASGDAGDGKERTALVLALESLQYKEGREEGQAKGRQPSKQMVIE